MPIYILTEWTNPKEEERNKKRYKLVDEVISPYQKRKLEEGVKWETLELSDGTGRMVILHTFETMEDFDKIWNDREWQVAVGRWSYMVDNCTARILRPVGRIEPE